MRIAFPALIALLTAAAPGMAEKVRYNRDIRPILSDNCFYCHGPDKSHREADLRLDLRDEALKAGAFTPGQPEKSSLLDRVYTHDEDDLMPPPESKKSLTEAQKKLLEQWIKEGAEYEPHWAYTPIVRPTPPQVGATELAPVDAFIQKELAQKSISPSPVANARTLIRRLSLDLTGLPPTPAEVEKFASAFDQEAAAGVPATQSKTLKALVERLLDSPHFGERWAAWWLDVARFSDTVGFHGDQNQRVFPYRDYVIQAFNSNKRFDQFTLEQLAGDLLPNATTEQRIASGFNRLNMMTREGGAQPKEYLAKYQADRVRTVGGAWLGATLGCSECHDHKFDPFTAHDFYAMSAYFADIKQFGVYSDYGYTRNPELKGWSNDHPFPPEILVESPYLKKRLDRLTETLKKLAAESMAKAPAAEVKTWQESTAAFLKAHPTGWQTPQVQVTTAEAPPVAKKGQPKPDPKKKAAKVDVSKAEAQADGSVLLHARAAQQTTLTFAPGAMTVAAIRLELLPHAAHSQGVELNGARNGMMLQPQFLLRKTGAKADAKLNIRHAKASLYEPRYSGTEEVLGVQGGWKTRPDNAGHAHDSVWLLEAPVALAEGDLLSLKLPSHSAGCLRVSVSPVAAPNPLDTGWISSCLDDAARKAQAWLASAPAVEPGARQSFYQLHREALACNDGKAWTQVTVAVKEPLEIRRLPRGNWMDESGEVCPPAPPAFLAGERPANAPRQSRVELARWLTSRENPLTARAFMNRLWKQFFGNGLSSAIDDLGAQGETPSHPELLDWLAAEFRDSGWDVQHMMRLIVTSHTYLQDSKFRPELKDVDPGNRLLAFQNARRLDAEFVRDNALFASGLLNLEIGGPSAHPYQPPGYYENLQFPSRDYIADLDERQWRRGVYMHWQRTFLHPMLANFDAPARDECTCSRNVSNTPQQALTLLNDPTFVEAARVFAQSLPAASDESRLDQVFIRALARLPKDAETRSLLTFLGAQRDAFQQAPEDARKLLSTGLKPPPQGDLVELAAWTSVCRVVLNLHETITRY